MAPARLEKELSLDVGGQSYTVHLVTAGVPHAIILCERVDTVDVELVGSMIRAHPVFGEDGANVDFVVVGDTDEFTIRTYERGIERETLACGSGCVAAAHLLKHKHLAGDLVTFRVASGDRIAVELPHSEEEDLHLVGPAVLVFEGYTEVDI
jgi:diaminopimelate epimerase